MQSIPSKRCVKCRTEQPVTAFHKDNRRPDGLFPYCKRCRRKDPIAYDEHRKQTAKGLRRCGNCGQWLDPQQFYSNRAKPDGLHHHCKACSIQQVTSRYQQKSAEERREHERRRRIKTPERFKQWYQQNNKRERLRVLSYSRTPAGKATQARANHRRRLLNKQIPATLTADEWQGILEQQGYRCVACGVEFSEVVPPTRDHVIPVTKGGALTVDNCQALCKSCNSSKRDKETDYRKTQTTIQSRQ